MHRLISNSAKPKQVTVKRNEAVAPPEISQYNPPQRSANLALAAITEIFLKVAPISANSRRSRVLEVFTRGLIVLKSGKHIAGITAQ